jgi:hypothetical protein
VDWELRDDNALVAKGAKSLPDIGSPQTLKASRQPAKTKSLRLRLRLYRPTGFVAVEKTLDWWEPRAGGLNMEEMKRGGIPAPE